MLTFFGTLFAEIINTIKQKYFFNIINNNTIL